MRAAIEKAERLIIKLGTRVLTHDDGSLALSRLFSVIEVAASWRRGGREVLIVTSGAVGLGRDALGFDQTPTELSERQACAAVGQSRLMRLYQEGFDQLSVPCGQVLLTQGDFDDRLRCLNLRATLLTLLRRGVVPVINENDAVSTEELAFIEGESRPVFGDNDKLSALVAAELGADLLVLLTDVEGIYARDPRIDPSAPLLHTVRPEDTIEAGGPLTAASRGGMASKLEAAQIAARSGCHAVIASGRRIGALAAVLAGEEVGSWLPAEEALGARRRWIAFAAAPRGRLLLDAGAVLALNQRGASLLAAGVVGVEGVFAAGDVVVLVGPDGVEVGRGAVGCDADTARLWCAGKPPEGVRNHNALVHRDHMVLQG
ncbi:MAG: glutamate 5-kinase [Myxococcota bacterium]|jgi:glutamate 5-kinase